MLIIGKIRRHNRNIFSIFYNMKVCCVFSLESLHRGNSNGYPQFTNFNIKKKKKKEMVLNHPKSNLQLWDFHRDSRTSSKELW